MAKNKQSKRQRDIKSKLMAAIAMLLVSTIMMVSSTYAWFTLSTAPEVTGITTAVGANGNLEMALQPLDGDSSAIGSKAGDSIAVQDANKANLTWGNLVDLSNSDYYGLDNIKLYPAKLNAVNGTIQTNPLATPEYGADGRVAELVTKTIMGVYNGEQFVESVTATDGTTIANPFGVRAIGTSSSMSDRQLAYRAALSAASTASDQAKRVASQSLDSKGAALADIAIKHATTKDGVTETYTTAELQPLLDIVNALLGDGTETNPGALGYIEESLIQYAMATALGDTTLVTDDNYADAKKAFEDATIATLTGVMEDWGVDDDQKDTYDLIVAAIEAVNTTRTDVVAAQTILNEKLYPNGVAVAAGTTFVWGDFNEALYKLANPEDMEVNKIAVKNLKNNWNVGTDVYTNGNKQTLTLGDQSTVEYVEYTYEGNKYWVDSTGTVREYDISTKNETQGTYPVISNMSRLVDAVLNDGLQLIIRSGAGVYADIADFCGDYSASVTLSEISYGGFAVKKLDATMKTETAEDPTFLAEISDSVPDYADGAAGSTASAATISDYYGYVIDLAFRTNVAGSSLQLQQAAVDRVYDDNTTNEDTMGHGASMTFQSTTDTFSGVAVKSLMECIRVVFFNSDTKAIIGYARLNPNSAVEDNGKITMTLMMTDAEGTAAANQTIMELEQNTIHELSIMVYLDGEEVTNADVANAASSMSGSMSLQFSSTAKLVPMEYTNLRNGDENDVVDYGKTDSTTTTYKVTINGTDVGQTVNKDASITYIVPEGYTVTAITMGGTDVMSSYDSATRVLTITAVTGDIAITATTT